MVLRNRILSGVGLVVTVVTLPKAIAAALDDRLVCRNYVTEPLMAWVFAMLVVRAAWRRQPQEPLVPVFP